MLRLSSFLLISSLAVGCAGDGEDFTYAPGPDRSSINDKADAQAAYKASYTCDGGTGDVAVQVEKHVKAIYVSNTEAGARFVAHSRSGTIYKLSADENDPYTDSDLMGSSATVSTGAFTGAKTIKLVLEGGESGAHYTCTIDS
jgi:hypothetical protein